MRQRLTLLFAVAALMVAATVPAGAVTRGGILDGEDHPFVGLMVAKIDGIPRWRCSGALISPTVYVTAGHCTFGADSVELWFTSDLEDPSPASYGYPFTGEVSGTPYTLPNHTDATWFLYDLGVVVLDTPVNLGSYPSLPSVGKLDDVGHGRNDAIVTAVGYGLQEFVEGPAGVGPDFDPKLEDDKTRYQAELMLVDRNGVAGIGNLSPLFEDAAGSFIISGDAKHGGTCFGDSGGPILLDGVLVGVNSFALNRNCAGVGGAYRVDQESSLDFIESFLP
ncbi:MAG TPA: trypsin-like serine protease [Acidimicrobiia bacterium]